MCNVLYVTHPQKSTYYRRNSEACHRDRSRVGRRRPKIVIGRRIRHPSTVACAARQGKRRPPPPPPLFRRPTTDVRTASRRARARQTEPDRPRDPVGRRVAALPISQTSDVGSRGRLVVRYRGPVESRRLGVVCLARERPCPQGSRAGVVGALTSFPA